MEVFEVFGVDVVGGGFCGNVYYVFCLSWFSSRCLVNVMQGLLVKWCMSVVIGLMVVGVLMVVSIFSVVLQMLILVLVLMSWSSQFFICVWCSVLRMFMVRMWILVFGLMSMCVIMGVICLGMLCSRLMVVLCSQVFLLCRQLVRVCIVLLLGVVVSELSRVMCMVRFDLCFRVVRIIGIVFGCLVRVWVVLWCSVGLVVCRLVRVVVWVIFVILGLDIFVDLFKGMMGFVLV